MNAHIKIDVYFYGLDENGPREIICHDKNYRPQIKINNDTVSCELLMDKVGLSALKSGQKYCLPVFLYYPILNYNKG